MISTIKQKYNLSKVDHHINNESYYDVDIYLKMTDVRYHSMWYGSLEWFRVKKTYEYSQRRLDISDEVKNIIKERINARISKYWDDYQNENLTEDDLPDLDIRSVFSDLPKFEYKSYLEGEKLFQRVAPFFNTKINMMQLI